MTDRIHILDSELSTDDCPVEGGRPRSSLNSADNIPENNGRRSRMTTDTLAMFADEYVSSAMTQALKDAVSYDSRRVLASEERQRMLEDQMLENKPDLVYALRQRLIKDQMLENKPHPIYALHRGYDDAWLSFLNVAVRFGIPVDVKLLSDERAGESEWVFRLCEVADSTYDGSDSPADDEGDSTPGQ